MLDNINTIVLLMFENRSFDHMLGHLSYNKVNDIDGLKEPLDQYVDIYEGTNYSPFRFQNDVELSADLPHEMSYVARQLDKSPANGQYQMDGFVAAYHEFTGASPNPQPDPLGFFDDKHVPITSFLGSAYCVCDRWFAALPTSTQPNRTMAFCGDSSIDSTRLQLISASGNIFDWMDRAGVKWRVYHDGLSFFVLYDGLWSHVLGDKFRDYEQLYSDFQSEPDSSFPQVIVVEPTYQDAPHFGSDHPNDNHPPLAVGWGEEFLRRTYEAVTCNPKRWGNTLMVVYYDEHGGFYDHVKPPSIGYTITGGNHTRFDSLGVRIPGILLSPYVAKGSVCHSLFDHTSVLQLLAEKFTPGKPYSATVADRAAKGIKSLSQALVPTPGKAVPVAPQEPIAVKSLLGDSIPVAPKPGTQQDAFEQAARKMMDARPEDTRKKYPELSQWRDMADKIRPAGTH